MLRQVESSRPNLITYWRQNQKEQEEKLHLLRWEKLGEKIGNKIFIDIKNPKETSKRIFSSFRLKRVEKKYLKLEFEFYFFMKELLNSIHNQKNDTV